MIKITSEDFERISHNICEVLLYWKYIHKDMAQLTPVPVKIVKNTNNTGNDLQKLVSVLKQEASKIGWTKDKIDSIFPQQYVEFK